LANFGDIPGNTDVLGKAVRTGSITVTALELTKAITFASNMPSVSFKVFFAPEGNLAAILWATSKATTGFTLNLSVGVAGTIDWLAVED
jgi:hypothetical protein